MGRTDILEGQRDLTLSSLETTVRRNDLNPFPPLSSALPDQPAGLRFSGWDSLLVKLVPTIVAISLRRDEPFAMHVMAPKQATKSIQR